MGSNPSDTDRRFAKEEESTAGWFPKMPRRNRGLFEDTHNSFFFYSDLFLFAIEKPVDELHHFKARQAIRWVVAFTSTNVQEQYESASNGRILGVGAGKQNESALKAARLPSFKMFNKHCYISSYYFLVKPRSFNSLFLL